MSRKHEIERIKRVGGRLCLDFINSVHQRPATRPEDDYLHELDDALYWWENAGLISADRRRRLAARASHPHQELADLKTLRELLHGIFERISQGQTPRKADIQRFAEHAGAARARQELRFQGGRAHWQSPPPDTPNLSLADPIVLDAEDLLTGDQLPRVKRCQPDAGCGWLFLDTSKNRSRRWCSMETCGSAHKARNWYHRHRHKRQSEKDC